MIIFSGIHTHFIVNKHIFDSNTWQRDDLVLKYKQSAEAQNYMITLNDLHTKRKCIDLNRERLYPIREEIDLKMAKGDAFSSYVEYRDEIVVVAFLPIKNLTDETVAWLVSYEKSPIIEGSLLNRLIIIIATFFLSILIIYFLIKETLSKQEISKQHKLLNNILNATDNVMFITDFKDVKFSNNKFKDLLNVQHSHIFNTSHNHYMLEIFVNSEGYLHSGLLKENESFVSLIARTSTIDRVVSIVDKNFVPVAFKISVSKSEDEDDYLVTLSDITKMKEHQTETEKKAYTDGLTNIYNRNKFDEVFVEEINNSQRFNIPFCIALIDIDKFKDFNDTYGHLIGDEVLISMAHTVNENVRVTDTFARWGGEEFVILFKNTTIDIAKKVSEKLKDRIEENRHPIAGSITASFGVTEYVASDTLESVFKRCDDALYAAKENGRNRVEVF